ncbi:MAG: choice-of-anchor tandem repeat GloVer-containing protein [Terriglobales bacterium]
MRRSASYNSVRMWGAAVLAVLLSTCAWAGSAAKVLYRFPGGRHGNLPLAGVVFDQAGNLYGTTFDGGAYGWGTVFELERGVKGWKQVVLHSFMGGADGANPEVNLSFDATGNLYGTTPQGGNSGAGSLFELSPSNGSWKYMSVFEFPGGDAGSGPSGVIFDQSGNLYGVIGAGNASTCQNGCVFELSLSGGVWHEQILYSFAGYPNDGAVPSSPLALDKSGNLYGETLEGGRENEGAIFELQQHKKGWKEVVLYSFSGEGRVYPEGGLTLDAAGNLYGTTEEGPSGYESGDVFELRSAKTGWTLQVLYSFTGGTDGLYPLAGVIFDAAGNLYGTTAEGGSKGLGTVFKLENKTWNETVLYNFLGGSNGDGPEAGVTLGPDGNLYGTSSSELSRFYGGTVFEVKP